MALNTIFPPTARKHISQYGYYANLGPIKTGFGPFTGVDVALLRNNFKIPI